MEKESFQIRVCTSGQHIEMVNQVLSFFEIKADSRLETMKEGQSLTALSTFLLREIETELIHFDPDVVVVQGDTHTALAGAMAGFYHGAKICHVEAGLRTFQNRDPFPEEMNRKLISQLADWHFAPTTRARANLLHEGIPEKKIVLTGNTIIDALNKGMHKIEKKQYPSVEKVQKLLSPSTRPFILATVHRRENQGEKLAKICQAFREVVETFGVSLIIPVHPNPEIAGPIRSILGATPNIFLMDPVPYPGFLWLMKNCRLILTDSGGIQEEATAIGKNVILLRETSERNEAIESGFVFKAGTDVEKIVRLTGTLLEKQNIPGIKNIFGSGDAAIQIVTFLKKQL